MMCNILRCPKCDGLVKQNRLNEGKYICRDCYENFDQDECLWYRCNIHNEIRYKINQPCPLCTMNKKVDQLTLDYGKLKNEFKNLLGGFI